MTASRTRSVRGSRRPRRPSATSKGAWVKEQKVTVSDVGAAEETTLGELLELEATRPEEQVEISLREEAVRDAVARLPQGERDVVRLRFGLDGDQPLSIEAVARRLELSPDRVRAMESRALSRLATLREVEALAEAA